jgi:hypothetical protein
MLEERLDDSDERRRELFEEWLHTAPHGEFWSIEDTWDDEATLGFRVDFAIIRRGE